MTLRTGPQSGPGYVPPDGLSGGQGFVTDTHVMVSAQQYIGHVGQVMTAEVDRLMANLEHLNPRTWDGEAYRAFLKAKDSWHAAHDHIMKALADIESCLGESSKRYDQADLDSQLGIDNAVKGLDYRI
ncbi:MAG TPA: WXG100 family type VII secretion target [Candidatus Dormibacteraeota bacterium]|nr:WXG100 family type VII secretion target [Candidatus Dormibacteraeota bacterium]